MTYGLWILIGTILGYSFPPKKPGTSSKVRKGSWFFTFLDVSQCFGSAGEFSFEHFRKRILKFFWIPFLKFNWRCVKPQIRWLQSIEWRVQYYGKPGQITVSSQVDNHNTIFLRIPFSRFLWSLTIFLLVKLMHRGIICNEASSNNYFPQYLECWNICINNGCQNSCRIISSKE